MRLASLSFWRMRESQGWSMYHDWELHSLENAFVACFLLSGLGGSADEEDQSTATMG